MIYSVCVQTGRDAYQCNIFIFLVGFTAILGFRPSGSPKLDIDGTPGGRGAPGGPGGPGGPADEYDVFMIFRASRLVLIV
jgi:hypothetical protein